MAAIPEDLKYTKEHEWVRVSDSEGAIGITEYAQNQLGDIVYVELPEVGKKIEQFEAFGVIESVKAASDLYMPVSGEVGAVNEAVRDRPELINTSPYDQGWIMKIKISDTSELDVLMSPSDYESLVASLGE